MCVALLSDVHANLKALKAVLAHLKQHAVTAIWFAGDVLGRGTEPIACLELLSTEVSPEAWVIGNHDAGVVGRGPNQKIGEPTNFREPNDSWWQDQKRLFGVNKESDIQSWSHHWSLLEPTRFVSFMRELPLVVEPKPNYWLAHGGLAAQTPMSTYLYDKWGAKLEFKQRQKEAVPWQYLVLGHTHLPAIFREDGHNVHWTGFQGERAIAPQAELRYGQPYPLSGPTIINPGSVGNPRDNLPHSYAILENGSSPQVTFYRLDV